MAEDARKLRVALIQSKPLKGQYAKNLRGIGAAFSELGESVDLVVLPEAALSGYFLEGAVHDLALPVQNVAEDLARTWQETRGNCRVDLVCGFFENDAGTFYNSAIYLEIQAGTPRIVHVHHKMFLPTYGVFDEERFLTRGRKLQVFQTRFGPMAMLVCEDIWHSLMPAIAAIKGAQVLVVPSAAPGRGVEGKGELTSLAHWRELLSVTAAEHGVYILYAGLTGFEGGKGMSGSSCVVDPHGEIIVHAPASEPALVFANLDLREIEIARATLPLLGDLGAVLPDLLLDEELPLPQREERAPGDPPAAEKGDRRRNKST